MPTVTGTESVEWEYDFGVRCNVCGNWLEADFTRDVLEVDPCKICIDNELKNERESAT